MPDNSGFFNWMIQKNDLGNTQINKFFNEEMIMYIFQNILCNEKKIDYTKITPIVLDCFILYFRNINIMKRLIVVENNDKFKVRSVKYLGRESIWMIFLKAKNLQVIESVCNLLSDLTLRLENGEIQ